MQHDKNYEVGGGEGGKNILLFNDDRNTISFEFTKAKSHGGKSCHYAIAWWN